MGAFRDHFNKTCRAWGVPALGVALAVVLAGCSTDVDQHGHLPDPEKIAAIQPGTSTKADIVKLIGSPSSVSTFDDNAWYYISRRTKQIAFFQPEVLDQQVFIVDFDDKGVVKDVGHKDLADGRSITPAPGATPAPGRELSFLEQLVGNIGKFNGGK
jgi:outer membrane protein assembly factor BamE (lipoprotein component of BamABCDE complex)